MGGVTDGLFNGSGSLMGGGGSAPSVNTPDPMEIIRAQGEARVDSFNPFGSLTFAGENRREGTLQLTPEMQNLMDSILASTGENGDFVSGLQDRTVGRLNQDFDLQQMRLQDQLTQSGNVGTGVDLAPGAVSELELFNRSRNDALIDALLGAEQVGANLQTSQLGNLGQIGSLALGGATPATPIDVTGAYGLNQNAQTTNAGLALQQQQGKNQLIGDLAGAGGAMVALSDIRLKKNIRKIGQREGANWYRWDWNGKLGLSGEGEGFLAQELLLTHPEKVLQAGDYLAVNYG